jgi:23S rRNA pseudouridine1911/1915/1917 synthase
VTAAERLDLHLVRLGLARSRRDARELLARGLVRVNGRILKKGEAVEAGARIEVGQPSDQAPLKPNADLPLTVLFEDPAMIVVNKPGLLPCHPIHGKETATVMNAVVARFPEIAQAGDKPTEGGLVHRLDNGTSGALIVARDPASFALLRTAIRGGRIERNYLALISGHLGARIELTRPIAHHPGNRRKMLVVHEDDKRQSRLASRPAATVVEPVRRLGAFTLVRVTPRTGMRHQIRVHLADAGFPLAGDDLYGGPPLAPLSPGRFFLHLSRLRFQSPVSGEVTIEAPLPPELLKALATLGG